MVTWNAGEDADKQEWNHSYIAGKTKNGKEILENCLTVFIKLSMELSCNLVITLLGIYLRIIKMYVHTKHHT